MTLPWHIEANKLRQQGLSKRAIGEIFNRSETQIGRVVDKTDWRAVHVYSPEGLRSLHEGMAKRRSLMDAQRNQIYRAVAKGYLLGTSVARIAKALGLTRNAVIGIAHRHGLTHSSRAAK